jgi:endonuclease/exonuclease/phosphatase (EEP) superfamily protein YafD
MSKFKVVQFNMQFGRIWREADPDHAPIELERTIAEIRKRDADVVLLQEVEQGRPGGAQPDPPPNYTRLRAAFPHYDGYFCYPKADPRELPFGVGLAILSRTPLREQCHWDLPSPPIEFEFQGRKLTPTDRLLIGAATTIGGHNLFVFNTHLLALFMLDSRAEMHEAQRKLVVDQVVKTQGPALIGGDFNVRRYESLVQQFARSGYRAVQTQEHTWRRRPYVLDHIFYNSGLRPLDHAVHPTPASDHHVLLAEFEFAAAR